MIEITLTQGKIALIDDIDAELVSQYKWCANQVGKHNIWYAYHSFYQSGSILMHNLILDTVGDVDHWDHDGLNNQRYNLRPCTRVQNNANRRKQSGTTSKYKGVSWSTRDRRWKAQTSKNNYPIGLGSFVDEDDAAIAYNIAAFDLFGEFATLNIIGIGAAV